MSASIGFRAGAAIMAAALAVAVSGCERTGGVVSYSTEVAPILEKNCTACHAPGAPGYEASGFAAHDYAAVMRGSRAGPMVRPGDPTGSRLLVVVEGRDPAVRMPHVEGMTLSADQVRTLQRWIEQGAKNN